MPGRTPPLPLLLRRASPLGRPDPVDVRLSGASIVEIGRNLAAWPGEAEIDADGGLLLPGLHDHHVHLRAAAAALQSTDLGLAGRLGPPQLASVLREEDRRRPAGEWIRAVGYHESIAGDIDRHYLDSVVATRPVRVQHRSGVLWILNSAALEAVSADRDPPSGLESEAGRLTGRLWRGDAWLRSRLPSPGLDLAAVSATAAAAGITGFTDATPHRAAEDLFPLAQAAASGTIVQRLHLMSGPDWEPSPLAGASLGPVKYLLDDDRLPSLPELSAGFRRAHEAGRPVAVHCVTRAQIALAVAAWEEAGTRLGDRIEHGALISADLFQTLRRLDLTVVTQPGFVYSRGDRYLLDVEAGDQADLWRLGSLQRAGVRVAIGTDAPFGPSDPWLTVRAAVDRRTAGGRHLGSGEGVAVPEALALFSGSAAWPDRPRTIAPGQPADLCLLSTPLDVSDDGGPEVAATIVGGRVVYQAG